MHLSLNARAAIVRAATEEPRWHPAIDTGFATGVYFWPNITFDNEAAAEQRAECILADAQAHLDRLTELWSCSQL